MELGFVFLTAQAKVTTVRDNGILGTSPRGAGLITNLGTTEIASDSVSAILPFLLFAVPVIQVALCDAQTRKYYATDSVLARAPSSSPQIFLSGGSAGGGVILLVLASVGCVSP